MVSQCTVLLKQKELASSQKTVTETPKKPHQSKQVTPEKTGRRQPLSIPCRCLERGSSGQTRPSGKAGTGKAHPLVVSAPGGLKDVPSDRIPFSSERSFSLQGKRHRNVLFMYWLRWHFWITVPYNGVFPTSKLPSSLWSSPQFIHSRIM